MLMANFNDALAYVLSNEGGFVDNPSDSGGATRCGISLRFYQKFCDPRACAQTIQNLSDSEIANIYHDLFWLKLPYAKIDSQSVSNYIFDCVINCGEHNGVQIAQRALQVANRRLTLKDDGIFGEITLNEINNASTAYLPVLMATRVGYYRTLVASHPDQIVFLQGWIKRALGL